MIRTLIAVTSALVFSTSSFASENKPSFADYTSALKQEALTKGYAAELIEPVFASLQFHWVEMERVVRIEGTVEKVSDEESDTYFHSRPLDSRIGAWASPQSQVIDSRTVLVTNAAKYGAQFLLNPPRPPHWGGFRLVPDGWEFWQGRKSRLHDRLRYLKQADGGWLRERLAP